MPMCLAGKGAVTTRSCEKAGSWERRHARATLGSPVQMTMPTMHAVRVPEKLEKVNLFVLFLDGLGILFFKAPLPARATVPLRAQEAMRLLLLLWVWLRSHSHQVYAHVQALSRSPSPDAVGTLFTACSDMQS